MNNTHNQGHRVMAYFLAFSLLLTSCYSFSSPTAPSRKSGRANTAPAKPRKHWQQGQEQQHSATTLVPSSALGPEAQQGTMLPALRPAKVSPRPKAVSPQSWVSSPRNMDSPWPSFGSQLASPKSGHKPNQQASAARASSLAQQKVLQASRQSARKQQQASLAQEDRSAPSLAEKSLLAQGGHQVSFFQQGGQWQAAVQEHLPAGFSRKLILPVYVAPGLSLQAVANYDKAQQQQRIHVIFAQPSYVYVGSRGLQGGGHDSSKEGGKASSLHKAVQRGDMDRSRKLLKKKPHLLAARDQYDQTPLHIAARMGHTALAQLLLKQGANLEARDHFDQTSLHVAAREGHVELAKLLLDQGANPRAMDYLKQTPAVLAQQEGHSALFLLLTQGETALPALSLAESQERQLTARLLHVLAAAQPISASSSSQQPDTPAGLLKELKQVFSADNVSSKLKQEENYKHMLRVKQAIENLREKQGYFQTSSLEEMLDYVYLLHALANYYTYVQYGGEPAQELLEEAKGLLEYHVTQRTGSQWPLASYSRQGLYQELSQVEGLAAMYARVLYSLARSLYFYQEATPATHKQAKQYFELAKYIAQQENLFEAILCDRSGLAIIKRDEVKAASSPAEAKEKLEEVLALYQTLAQDTGSYIQDYNPGIGGKELKLREDDYYQLECKEQVARCYEELAAYATEPAAKAGLFCQGLGYLLLQGIDLRVLEQKAFLRKKSASIYNTIGRLIHGLWQLNPQREEVGLQQLAKEGLLEQLVSLAELSSASGVLQLAEAFYQRATNKSRETEFTRGDGLYNLAVLYEQAAMSEKALAHYQEALQVYEAINHPKLGAVKSKVAVLKGETSLQEGADNEDTTKQEAQVSEEEESSEAEEALLHDAALRGDVLLAKRLIRKRPELLEARDGFGFTPLHRAAIMGQLGVVEVLLEAGANLATRNNFEQTILHSVAIQGYDQVAQRLLKAGASLAAQDDQGQTPWDLAVKQGHVALSKVFLRAGASLERRDGQGRSPLHRAAWGGHLALVKLLIAEGAALEALDNQGNTAPALASKAEIRSLLRKKR